MEPYHSAFLEAQAELDEAQAERDEARRNGKNYDAVATDFAYAGVLNLTPYLFTPTLLSWLDDQFAFVRFMS